jgi:6-phosphogluconolactonase (cycloisomerase 2 family)
LGHTIPQLSFKPNLKLCGSDENVLLTSLTYNIPKPKYIDSSLMFDQLVAVKHSDGTHTFISGTPNTKALYGWDDIDRKLVELDVKNYKINKTDGTLTLKKPYRNTVQVRVGLDLDGADGLFLSKMIVGKLQQ